MTIEQRNFCFDEMSAYTDRDSFVSDLALSSIWNDAEDDNIPDDRVKELAHLWDIVHLPMGDLLTPLSMIEISRRFYIPYRTVQDWFAGVRSCPLYVRLLLADAIANEH